MKKAIIGTLGALAIASPAALAEVEAEFHVGFSNEYIFRGAELGDDLFEYGLDVAGSCKCGLDWSAGIWYASFDLADADVNELNIYGEVSKDLGFGSVALGFIHYDYDEQGIRNDDEIYLGLSTAAAGIDLGATVYYGVGPAGSATDDTWYFEFSAGKSLEISDKMTLDLELKLGTFDSQTAPTGTIGGGEDTYGQFTAGISYAVSDEITLSPYVSVVQDFDGDEDDHVFGGVVASYSF